MNKEQWSMLLDALVAQGVAPDRAGAHELMLDIWKNDGPEAVQQEYDAYVGRFPSVAGKIGRIPEAKMDSATALRHMFSMDPDSADAFAARIDSLPEATDSANRIPDSRAASMRQSPVAQVMRIPGMTMERATAMPRSRQDAIARSDPMHATMRGDGSVRDLARGMGDEFRRRGRLASDMDDMGTTGAQRFGVGAVFGAPMAAHRLLKGGLGLMRFAPGGTGASAGAAYDMYDRATRGFENAYEWTTPSLGKSGVGGEMVGGSVIDIPLYASGTKAVEALPLLQRMLAGGRTAGAVARVGSNAVVDAAQGVLTEFGNRVPTGRGLAANVGLNVGLGAPLNLGMETLGGIFGRRGGSPFDRNMTGGAFELLGDDVLPPLRRRAMTSPAPAAFDLLDDAPPKYNKLLSEMARQGRPRTHGYMVPEY